MSVIQLHPGKGTTGQDALETMDNWRSDMQPHSKAVIIYSDAGGNYHTYAVNCSMAEALGYSTLASEMLLDQVRS
jgi:hypothetical protein